jgi:hypothetical protein
MKTNVVQKESAAEDSRIVAERAIILSKERGIKWRDIQDRPTKAPEDTNLPSNLPRAVPSCRDRMGR